MKSSNPKKKRRWTKDFPHPQHGDLFTPMTPDLVKLFEKMSLVHGSHRMVCALTNTRMRVFRRMRHGQYSAISLMKLDVMITATEVGDLRDYPWYTADEMVAMGIWKPTQYVIGKDRVKYRK